MIPNFSRRPSTRMAVLFVALMSVVGVANIAFSPAANASASGCSAWGAKTIGNIPVAKGVLSVGLNGNGTCVATVADSFNAAGAVCNTNVTAEFFDQNGASYDTVNNPVRYDCTWQGSDVVSVFKNVRRETMCSTFKTNGARVQSVCHSIY